MVFTSIGEHASGAFIFLMRAASTLEIANEQRALRKYSASWKLSLLKRFAPSKLADTFKTGQQAQS